MTKRPSLRGAINAMCRQCIFDRREPGSWLDQVARCTAPRCPLYEVRPGRDRANTAEKTAFTGLQSTITEALV